MSDSTLQYRFKYVKEQIDDFDYISSVVKLKKVGLVYRGLCPFHNEKTPSFTVYPRGYQHKGQTQDHTSFYCFGCKAGGDVFEFRKRYENLNSVVDALIKFEEELGINYQQEDVEINYLKESLKKIEVQKEKILTISETNITCSIMCRNYLEWVKDYYPEYYDEEVKVIEKYYFYLDKFFEEKSAIECMNLIEEVRQKLERRKQNIMKNYEKGLT